jgi:membrane fusion protein, multidrug efflux system
MHISLYKSSSAALIGGLLLALSGCQSSDQADQPHAAPPPPKVGVIELQANDVVLSTEVSGRTSPYLIAEVRPQVSGIVRERLFEEGSQVAAGQVLYQIDPSVYEAALDSAKATQARDEAQAQIAQLKVRRYANLIKKQAVSQEDYDEVQAQLKQALATVAMDKAAVASAEIDLAYTRVTSPIAGRIGRSSVTQGALVTANQAAQLATVQRLDPIYVDLNQSSTELLRLKRSLSDGRLKALDSTANVELILEDGSRYAQRGRLQFSEVSVDRQTGTVLLRAVFPNPDHELLPGMYVRAVLHEGIREQAILAPQRAVSRDAKGKTTALVLNAENTVESRELTINRAVGNDWLVDSGLRAGDRLIVDGLQKIKPGASAEAVPFAAPAVESAENDTSQPRRNPDATII